MSTYTEIRNDIAKVFGWSTDTLGDVLATVGGAIVAYYAAENIPLVSAVPLAGTIAASIWSAIYWKRARRDNG
ncbi:MAG: hypothetical protein NXH88_10010 [Hyphomonas sp.]|nr:hypothetical protein [Hyphomonas sp.]